MTKNFFGKKIFSSLLAVVILVSLVAVPAMAQVPREYVITDGKYITNGFEATESPLVGITKSLGTFAQSGSQQHSGTYSMEVTANKDGHFQMKIDPSKFAGSDFGFEPNKKYYLSFWAYSDNDVELLGNFAASWTPYADKTPTFKKSSTSTTGRTWKKWWTTFETSPVNNSGLNYLTLTFYNMGAGTIAYVDDVEIAEITDASATTNAVPSSAAVVKQGYVDGSKTTDYTVANGLKVSTTYENSNFGQTSYKVESTTLGGILADYFFVYPEKILNVASMEKSAWYYASFYVYVPGTTADVSMTTRNAQKVIAKKTIPADTWVKLSGLVDMSNYGSMYWLWGLNIDNTTSTMAYVDDLVIAQLNGEPASATLEVSEVNVNKLGAGTLTLTSTIELDEASLSTSAFTFSDDGVVTDVKLNDTKTEAYVSFDMGNAKSDTLAVSIKDVFDRTVTGSFVVNNNASVLEALNSDTSFEEKQGYKIGGDKVGISGTDTGTHHYTSSGEAKTGKVSVGMKYDESKNNQWIYNNEYYLGGWQTDFTLVNGNKYYYEFYAKISDDAETETCALSTVMNNAYTAGNANATINKSGWTKVRNVLDFTEMTGSISHQILINLSGLKTGEIVYMDDFKIYEIPANQELTGNFYVSGGDVEINGDKAEASLTLTNTYFDKETIPVRIILATYNGDTLVDADVVDKNLGFGDEADVDLSASKGAASKIFVWRWPDLTPLCK